MCAGANAQIVLGVRPSLAPNDAVTLTLDCGTPDEACARWRAENPEHPAVFHFDRHIADETRFVVDDADLTGGNGWWLLENLHCILPTDDCFDTISAPDRGGKMLGIRLKGVAWNIGTSGIDNNNNAFSTHGHGSQVCIGCTAYGYTTSPNATGAPVAPTGTGVTTMIASQIGGEHVPGSNSTTPMLFSTGNSIYLIDTDVVPGPGTLTSGVHIYGRADNTPGSGAKDYKWVFSGGFIGGGHAQFVPTSALHVETSVLTAPEARSRLEIYDTLLSSTRCLSIGQSRAGHFEIVGRGVVLAECEAANVYDYFGELLAGNSTTIDFEGIYDEDDPGDFAVINQVGYPSPQAAAAVMDASDRLFREQLLRVGRERSERPALRADGSRREQERGGGLPELPGRDRPRIRQLHRRRVLERRPHHHPTGGGGGKAELDRAWGGGRRGSAPDPRSRGAADSGARRRGHDPRVGRHATPSTPAERPRLRNARLILDPHRRAQRLRAAVREPGPGRGVHLLPRGAASRTERFRSGARGQLARGLASRASEGGAAGASPPAARSPGAGRGARPLPPCREAPRPAPR